MAKIARFWRGLADSLECAECGATDWRIARQNYETRGEATCDQCDAEATYYRRGRTQPDVVRGAVVPESIPTSAEYRGEGGSEDGR